MASLVAAAGITLDLEGPLPKPPPYSLLTVPGVLVEDPGRWLNGVEVYGYPQELPQLWDPCSVGTFRDKDLGGEVPSPRFDAFGLYIPITCSTLGLGSWEPFKARARVVLEATQSYAVERVLSQGVDLSTNTNPYFGDANVNVLGGGPVDPNTGLSWLEKAIGNSGRFGLIHAPPEVVTRWDTTVYPDGTLRSKAGTVIAVGGGYSGASANGNAPAAGQSYAFATGAVQVRLSEIGFTGEDLVEALDRSDNVVTFRAERFALATWDGLAQPNGDIIQAAAVLIDWTP
jgi:hypothetical protein